MSDSLWMVPIWALAGAGLFRLLFAAPYELWRQEKERADSATLAIEALGMGRQLRFLNAGFQFNYATPDRGPLATVRLFHCNASEQLIGYRLANVWAEVNGIRFNLLTLDRLVYIQPQAEGHYDCGLPEPVEIASFPAVVRINFDYFYDTVPATRERHSGATLRFIITAPEMGAPVEGHWYEDQREA
ncbi:MAG: hypothetical protein ACT6Q5_07760 [Sphingopyxis solisilvae]|uniref:hypothetical protein n=1 Tax=Sphingopyxis solisilvae TaxID=1886788 RepID=UPI0040358F28